MAHLQRSKTQTSANRILELAPLDLIANENRIGDRHEIASSQSEQYARSHKSNNRSHQHTRPELAIYSPTSHNTIPVARLRTSD